MFRRLLPLLAATVALLTVTAAVHADGSWMDGPLTTWNVAGMAVPAAPPLDPNAFADPRCTAGERPVETAPDQAVVDAGWRLFNAYEAGWGVTVVSALSGYDGMCRPFGYQHFVFVDNVFAGTLSPEPMNARFDGSATRVSLFHDRLLVTFNRYAPSDPLCCPSRTASVTYHIAQTDSGPVVVPVDVFIGQP